MKIPKGSNWKHKKTKKCVIVLNDPGDYGHVELLHSSGRKTIKQHHYFLYDYQRVE